MVMFLILWVMCDVMSSNLCLDDVPSISQAYVVLWVVESQPILQILFSILTHLEMKNLNISLS